MPTLSTRGANCSQAYGSFIEIKPLPPPPDVGTYIHGGFYFGRIRIANVVYNLIVSDRSVGQYTGPWSDINGTTPTPNSVNDGYKNTYNDTSVSHPSSDWAQQLDINGYDDWYIPSRDELELMYRVLKPTTDHNYVGNQAQFPGEPVMANGVNNNSVPKGEAYTATNPGQTSVAIFREGSSQPLQTNGDGSAMGSSTSYFSLQSGYMVMTTGQETSGSNRFDFAKRAIRRVPVGYSPDIGDFYGGGYFTGIIRIDNVDYNLIISPKDGGSSSHVYFDNGTPLPADVATSLNDGWANTNKNNKQHYPACQWARNQFINGYNDWYIPARDELELMYRNFKATATHNSVTNRPLNPPDTVPASMGTNASSVPPLPGYTTTDPSQTTFASFQSGGSEAESPGADMWTSSTIGGAPSDAIYQRTQSNMNGVQETTTVNATQGVRLFRRERIS